MQNEITKIIYKATKMRNTKLRSELVIDPLLEAQILEMGANSHKAAKFFLN